MRGLCAVYEDLLVHAPSSPNGRLSFQHSFGPFWLSSAQCRRSHLHQPCRLCARPRINSDCSRANIVSSVSSRGCFTPPTCSVYREPLDFTPHIYTLKTWPLLSAALPALVARLQRCKVKLAAAEILLPYRQVENAARLGLQLLQRGRMASGKQGGEREAACSLDMQPAAVLPEYERIQASLEARNVHAALPFSDVANAAISNT